MKFDRTIFDNLFILTKNVYNNLITKGGEIILSFLNLTDTPSTYSGQGGKIIRVNSDEDGVEFQQIAYVSWYQVTADEFMVSNKGYITNSEDLITLTLPTLASVGQQIGVCGKGTGGWKIAQSSGQQIIFGTLETVAGSSGYIASTEYKDDLILLCIVANTTWKVVWSTGSPLLSLS